MKSAYWEKLRESGIMRADEVKQLKRIVSEALAEDLAYGDVTTEALVPSELEGKAAILVKKSFFSVQLL